PKRQAHPEPDGTLGVPLLRGDSCALHPGPRTHGSQSDRRAPPLASAPGKAICVVLPIKMHPNQALYAECRIDHAAPPIPSERMELPKAVEVCQQAVAEHPSHPRMSYQYGRALM